MNDDLKYTFNNVNDWLKFAEAKHVALITLIGAMIFGIIQSWSTLPVWMHPELKYFVLPLFFISLIICLRSFIPKLDYSKIIKRSKKNKFNFWKICKKKKSKKEVESEKNINLLYYGDLRFFKVVDLIKQYNITTSNNLDKDLAQQIIINSNIGWRKHTLFKISGNLVLFTIISGAIIIALDQVINFDFTSFVLSICK